MMLVIAKRMLLFLDPDVESLPGDKDVSNLRALVQAKRRFVLTRSTQPQECPSWVAELDSFKQAIEAGAIERA